nr:unnamed protein product [Digitaria exilis]
MSTSRDPLVVGNIVGDIVDHFPVSALLRLLYGGRELTCGSEMRPSQVATEPTVHITGGGARAFYTLVMVDPDSPSPSNPSKRERSWCQSWKRGGGVREPEANGGDSPALQQAIYAPGWRANFNTRDFAACYSLGEPVAAIYFNCQREGGCGGRRYS